MVSLPRAPSPLLPPDPGGLALETTVTSPKGAPVVAAPGGQLLEGLRAAVQADVPSALPESREKEMERRVRELARPTREMEEAEGAMEEIDDRLRSKSQELSYLEGKMREAGDFDPDAGRDGSPEEDDKDGESKGRRGRMGLEWQREIAIRSRAENWNARQARLIAQKRLQFDVAKLQEERRLAEARSQRLAKMDMQRVEQYKFRVKTDLLNKDRERHIAKIEEERKERTMAHDARVQTDSDQAKAELLKRIDAARQAHSSEFNNRLHGKKIMREFMDVARTARQEKIKYTQKLATERELEKLEEWRKSRDVEKELAGPAVCVIERLSVPKDERDAQREEKIRQREAARNERAVKRHQDVNARPAVGLGRQLNGLTEKALVRGDISIYYLSSSIAGDGEESSDEEHIL